MKTTEKKGTIIKLVFNVPDEELNYILSGCFEGGSNYWIGNVQVKNNEYLGATYTSEVPAAGGVILITEDCNEVGCEVVVHELDKRKLLVGIIKYGEEMKTLNFDEMDAGDYDLILQYALFKEQKYC